MPLLTEVRSTDSGSSSAFELWSWSFQRTFRVFESTELVVVDLGPTMSHFALVLPRAVSIKNVKDSRVFRYIRTKRGSSFFGLGDTT